MKLGRCFIPLFTGFSARVGFRISSTNVSRIMFTEWKLYILELSKDTQIVTYAISDWVISIDSTKSPLWDVSYPP